MSYKFIKVQRNKTDQGNWFFVPKTKEQLLEHFNKIFGSEIKDGVRDRIDSTKVIANDKKDEEPYVYVSHPSTPFARAVQCMLDVCGGSWVECAVKLENQVLQQRLKTFESGKEMLLDNGVVETFLIDTDVVVEELEKDSLEYPIETQMRLDEVRYMKWDMSDLNIKGTHWYAKIGKLDIVDKDGNMKWNTKEEAEKAAKWFIENNVSYKRYR